MKIFSCQSLNSPISHTNTQKNIKNNFGKNFNLKQLKSTKNFNSKLLAGPNAPIYSEALLNTTDLNITPC